MSIRTSENAKCSECRLAPRAVSFGGTARCPVIHPGVIELESHRCPLFVPSDTLAQKRLDRQTARENLKSQEPLF